MGGRPIVVGGSDALAEPQHYLKAGATAVVQDKSGGANWALFGKFAFLIFADRQRNSLTIMVNTRVW
ncbi:hypothetical protein [Cylindrospermopsis curvispora]|uniref:Uncharacterized protein n=1 Tax=Cylindrospermopsis curvispora GIHE-G1 TaxID=2666332 RepID=A0A7H0F5L2_9CYAN|nr:hypothetical protein [Cylindrospermopsis curvispora]QNP31328.1 hypothetical protein IAR63_17420 [Cylindrospermopsis curvispora GIHE-G1]BAZ91609.1 radical SAM domain-containing protein [Raphidiopsis curvata NIES-932]